MDNEARLLLDDAIAFCRRDGLDTRLINMLASARATNLTEDALTIEAPSRFAYSYLVKQRTVIERYLEEIAFAPLALNITVPQIDEGTPTSRTEPVQPTAPQARSEASKPMTEEERPTASTQVSGMGSVAAHAASTAPRTEPGTASHHSGPALAVPAEGGARRVSVTNTMSPDQFRRMMADMKREDGAAQAPAPAAGPAPQPVPAEEQAPDTPAGGDGPYPAVGINAKFTFENFVLGDENRHAYQSAARFAAFADEPGQCTSLFIYGNSGLGKTHLLFAIKNYLASEKPYIRVKYANSQAYLDDYMRDLGSQRGPGEPIMREYRNADVLIIDDIQNIIGRQASIEFFFQLVDEFIRENKKIVIAIDGFSSCGKSTFAKAIARRLGYIFIDTGAMYRAVTLYALEHGAIRSGMVDEEAVVRLLPDICIDFRFNPERGASDIYVDGDRVEGKIRTIEVSNCVSAVSSICEVRAKLVAMQQQMGRRRGVVMDGRDIGTTVFPDAELKIFMTARPSVRARRRYDELRAKGDEVSYEEILQNVLSRDKADMTRAISPLRKADDAVVLDNSCMTVAEQMEWFEKEFRRAIGDGR